jgi:hypothetical protein
MSSTNTDTKKKMMIDALKKTLGNVSAAASQVGISRNTHYDYLKSDNNYRKEVDSISEMAIDFVEGKLFESIQNGSDTAIIFYLKTKAKARGYIEKTTIDLHSKPFDLKKTILNFMNERDEETKDSD